MGGGSVLETDYLVVGAGALGMAFVDSLIDHCDADIIMVDRHDRPGGHWLESYPFVQLHQPSRFYGVNSTALGGDRIELSGMDAGCYERASGAEICSYYDEIMRHRFLTSGRVRFFPMWEYLGDSGCRSRITGQATDITVRRRLVDATYMASRVPATDPVPSRVAGGVHCVPVGGLSLVDKPPAGYVIIGGGKTAADAICWLLDRGADPDHLTWIRPGDSWMLNRAFFQPGQPRTLEGIVLQLEAMVASSSVSEVYERLEADEVVVRTDRTIVPSMMKGATISSGEVGQLRQVKNVVRLGHIERIVPDRIVLEQGSIPTSTAHLHVHCAASGLSDNPPRPIYTDDTVTLQLVTRVGVTLSGALLGFLEASGRTTQEKNRLCRPTAMPHTPFDYLRAVMAGISTEMAWQEAPDLAAWLDRSRLNLLHGLEERNDRMAVRQLQSRFFAALFPALDKLQALAERATHREQARIFEVGSPADP